MKILLVEDDEIIAKTLENILTNHHYAVDIASDGEMGWKFVEAFGYDLILLDVILPKLDGIKFCQQLRKHHNQTPVMLLTAQNSHTHKVIGLDAGADDYLVKPFEVSELLARIRVLLRRKSVPIQAILQWENLCLNPASCDVTYKGKLLNLTPKEYRLLELFLRNSNSVLSRSKILDYLWSVEEAPKEDTVTAHIKGLRQKLKEAGAESDLIETVYGLGYRLKQPNSKTSSLADSKQGKQKQQTQAALAELWTRSEGKINQRLAILEQAVSALLDNRETSKLQQQAQHAAHKLAGSLGVFGFTLGSNIAKQIEEKLQTTENLDDNEKLQIAELIKTLKLVLFSDRGCNEPSTQTKARGNNGSPVVLIVDDAKAETGIVNLILASGMQIELVPNLEAAVVAIANSESDVVLLQLNLANTDEKSLALLAELTNRTPPIPVLLYTADDDFHQRLRMLCFEAHVFLQSSYSPEKVLEIIKKLVQAQHVDSAQIMVVDDDPQVLAGITALLEPWGLQITTLDKPLQFWNIFTKLVPDLLVIDVEMPEINGIKICQLVRNNPTFCNLPIIFFTVHQETPILQQVFSAGADECLSKNLAGQELLTHIFNRLERVRLLKSVNG